MPDFNVMVGGSPCFVAGTQVFTSNGHKNIEELTLNDQVLTHENRYRNIVKIGSEFDKDIYELNASGILPIKCTSNHPFLVRHRKVKYCCSKKFFEFTEPKKLKLKDINVGDYIGVPIISESENIVDLSYEECWLLGRYVADGHISNSGVVFSIGYEKIDEFERLVKENKFRKYPYTQSCYRIVFNKSSKIYSLISTLGIHNYAKNKNIPISILRLPIEHLKVFLDGYFSGDGCKVNGYIQATTISRELAEGLVLAVQKAYRVGCRIYKDAREKTNVIEGRVVNQHDTYMIRFSVIPKKHKQWYLIDDVIWYRIRSITDANHRDVVYNIEVDEDHTYTANNAIVFNCQDLSVAGKQGGTTWTCDYCGHSYNPLEAHYSTRDKCPECGKNTIEKTRSSLLVEWLRFLREKRPNFAIYENVKNIVGSRFKSTFDLFIKELEEYGYNVYWKVLNAKHYGIPQNRERVYCIIIRKDLDNGLFEFPQPVPLENKLCDLLEDKVDERYYLDDEKVKNLLAPAAS